MVELLARQFAPLVPVGFWAAQWTRYEYRWQSRRRLLGLPGKEGAPCFDEALAAQGVAFARDGARVEITKTGQEWRVERNALATAVAAPRESRALLDQVVVRMVERAEAAGVAARSRDFLAVAVLVVGGLMSALCLATDS